ncbi:unnamed protein product [Rangifer tarandus platyrhynchus]|uniref:Uncharacterized protein n=1 Tax=Rangifer tarandus platyrhynchus TaxID=3082113 RepID=A0AC59YKE6_RANTA
MLQAGNVCWDSRRVPWGALEGAEKGLKKGLLEPRSPPWFSEPKSELPFPEPLRWDGASSVLTAQPRAVARGPAGGMDPSAHAMILPSDPHSVPSGSAPWSPHQNPVLGPLVRLTLGSCALPPAGVGGQAHLPDEPLSGPCCPKGGSRKGLCHPFKHLLCLWVWVWVWGGP